LCGGRGLGGGDGELVLARRSRRNLVVSLSGDKTSSCTGTANADDCPRRPKTHDQ
jgi:hypothetical protein